MTTSTNSFYPGKQEFDVFLTSLPKDEKNLSEKDILSLSLQAAELFNKGIPHKDRSICLYYFYHFLGLNFANSSNTELANQFVSLTGFAITSLSEPSVLEYLKLLDAIKLYEVCQVRGEIKMFSIELVQFIAGKTTKSWAKIAKEAESFLLAEPCTPQSFLECYFDGICLSENSQARRYELAVKIWETSIDVDSLERAWSTLNDTDDLRAFKKDSLPPKEAKIIFELEQIGKEVLSEFGENWHGKNTLGKTLQFLSKQGREEKKALDEICIQWLGRINRKLSFSGNDPYVKGYAAFLSAFVRGGTEDLKGAAKELKKAIEFNFDPDRVLSTLVPLLDILKKSDEAIIYAQQLVDVMSFTDKDKNKNLFQPTLLIFKQVGKQPIWANRIWESRVKENQNKVSTFIKALEPLTESAKKKSIEQRTQSGIKLLDNLFPLTKADEALNSKTSFASVNIPNSVEEILELSIEEIEPFSNVGFDKILFLFSPHVTLDNLLNYNELVINSQYGNLSVNLETALKAFPNTLACVPLAKRYIAELITTGKQDFAKSLANHLCEIRNNPVEGLYDAIKPVQQGFKSQQQFRQEIEFITNSRKLLNERERKQATIHLIEAYVNILGIEKSLNEKDRLLKTAFTEQLQDERLDKFRVEVDDLLNKRKKMLIRAGLILGTAIVLFAVIYVLFIK